MSIVIYTAACPSGHPDATWYGKPIGQSGAEVSVDCRWCTATSTVVERQRSVGANAT